MSIKLILPIPQTPLFIAFAGAKKFWEAKNSEDFHGLKSDIIC